MKRTFLALLLTAAPAALAGPVTFAIDSGKSELLAFTKPTGIFKGASHSHLIKAEKIAGKIVYDAEAPAASTVTVSFPVSALTVDDPALRKREGMTSNLSENDRKQIDKDMRGEKQLNEKKFGQISFESTRVTAKGAGKLEVTGALGIHGVKKTVTLPIAFSVKDGAFRGEGKLTFNHKDFGLEPFTAVLGTVRNAEPIRLKILLVGTADTGTSKQSGAAP
jgi:polyisoprenoid-binding protein YceI